MVYEDRYSDDNLILQRHNLEVEFENMMAGKGGYYDPSDPSDVNYLTLNVYVVDHDDKKYGRKLFPEGSITTMIPADTPVHLRRQLLRLVADRIVDYGADPLVLDPQFMPDLTQVIRALQWVQPNWLVEQPLAS